jgi:zinc protease
MKQKFFCGMIISIFATMNVIEAKTNSKIEAVEIKNSSPLITFRILFNVGPALDPAGKEGVASLTAAMLSRGGSATMAYDKIIEAMYPMAASINAQVDKEMTVFFGTTHLDNLDGYYKLISEMLLNPGWREEDFTRVRTDAINFLKVSLSGNNDEELGKEALYRMIYAGHPYSHENTGTISALEKMTLNDVKNFYKQYYTQANIVIGIAGNYSESFLEKMKADFAKLPAGTRTKINLQQPKAIKGLHMQLVKKETRATAISFGAPIAINRSHPDWPALWLVRSYLGEHRSSNSYLYQRIREVRGMNYGDYAYIEYFPRGMFQFQSDANLCRQQQIFQVWIRPVEPQNAHFAVRVAMFELKKLIDKGMTKEDFEATRNFLSKNVNVLVKTQDQQLGYALDSKYYGIPEFTSYVRSTLAKLTADEVNRVIKQYLQADNLNFVFVTKDAEGLKEKLAMNTPSPITYNAAKPDDLLAEDKIIETYALPVKSDDITIVPVEEVFLK